MLGKQVRGHPTFTPVPLVPTPQHRSCDWVTPPHSPPVPTYKVTPFAAQRHLLRASRQAHVRPWGVVARWYAGGEDQTASLVCREGEAWLNTSQCTGWPHITEGPSCANGERSPAPDQKAVPAVPPSLVQVEGTRSPSAALDKHATLGIQSPGAAGAGRAMQNLGILPPNCGILPLEENGEAGLEKTWEGNRGEH